jgi:hypothetical protein
MKRAIATVLLVCAASATAFATRITNKDGKKYSITIVDAGKSKTKTIAAKSDLTVECSDKCTFKIKGSKVVATNDDHVVLESGQLSISK